MTKMSVRTKITDAMANIIPPHKQS